MLGSSDTQNVSERYSKLRSRLLSADFEAWNNPRRAKLSLPVFVLVGGGLGIFIQSYGVLNNVPLPVLWMVFTMLGITVLALID
jgi:hypothetical protein